MRIATANILHGLDVRGMASGRPSPTPDDVDLEAVAGWVGALDADVVALQEVDCRLDRSGGVDQVAWLADRLGYDGVFGAALVGDPDHGWDEVPADGLPAGAGGYGIGLMSRVGLSDVRRERLPHGGPGTRVGRRGPADLGSDTEPRVVLSATLDGGLRVSTTHLSYMFWHALPQLGRALAVAADTEGPAVLVGDLNLPMWAGWLAVRGRGLHPWGWPDAATAGNGWTHLRGAATFPAWSPRLQLDHAYARHVVGTTAVAVGPRGPSDHLPLVLTL